MVGSATYTVTYAYEDAVWKDRLTAYNDNEITYDTIGNPVTWHNNADLTWENGRQLVGYTKGSKAYTYTYNDEGIRTSKTVNGVTTTYTVVDGVLRRMTIGSGETATTLQFFENSVLYNGTEYWYVYNAQNDVVGLIDNTGAYVVEYTYNAWGRLLSTTGSMADTLGKDNPYRYRGYIYDEETGLYYVSSRYYDPDIGRWLNADGQISGVGGDALGYNMFAYCFNNPINMSDPTGHWPTWGQVFAAVATVAVATVFVAAVVASAGTVGIAAGMAAASIGASSAMVGAAITVGTVGTYAVAAGIGACALSNAGEILTGTNVIRDTVFSGDQESYDTAQAVLNMAGCSATYIGSTANITPSRNTNNSYNLNGAKDQTYINKRGWDDDMIKTAINNGPQDHPLIWQTMNYALCIVILK